MTTRPLMDAGPGINFFALHKERLLIATVGPLAVPETVREEIRAKARREQRFAAAERVLAKLPTKYLKSSPMTQRRNSPRWSVVCPGCR